VSQVSALMRKGPAAVGMIRQPGDVEGGVTSHDATIGHNFSIEGGSCVTEGTIANSILGRNGRVVRGAVADSVIGDDQVIEGKTIQRSVLDAGELAPAT